MRAIRRLEEYLRNGASPSASSALGRLIEALEEEKDYPLSSLYEVDYEAFELAIDLLRDWRVDRYYAKEMNLLDALRLAGEPEASCVG